MLPDRSVTTIKPNNARSAVTNGRRLHVQPVGDTAWTRRFRDLIAEIVDDLGGPAALSEGQRQLVRRAAMLSVECEKMEAVGVTGAAINLDEYGRITDRLGRTFQRLGLKRQAREAPRTIHDRIMDEPTLIDGEAADA